MRVLLDRARVVIRAMSTRATPPDRAHARGYSHGHADNCAVHDAAFLLRRGRVPALRYGVAMGADSDIRGRRCLRPRLT